MKRFVTLIFASVFAFAFTIGFVACKKDKPADEAVVESVDEAPAADEAKDEEAAD